MFKPLIRKIGEFMNIRIFRIHTNKPRDFSNSFFPRPSTFFIKKLNKEKPLVGAEIGVFHGVNAMSMLKTLSIKKIYLIDPYFYESFDGTKDNLREAEKKAKKRLSKYSQKTEFIKEPSKEAASSIPDNLDFVYIDGNHNYKCVKKDMEIYYKKLRKGGILAGHDIDNATVMKHKGVLKAFFEFIDEKKLEPYIHSPDWWVIKK